MISTASRRLTAGAGIGFAVLFLGTFLTSGETPSETAGAGAVLAYYRDHATQLRVGSFVLVVAAVLLLLFAGGLREALRVSDDRFGEHLATVAFGGAVVAAIGLATFAMSANALADAGDLGSRPVALALNLVDNSNFFPVMIGLATLFLATGIAGLSGAALPRWLVWASIVLGVCAPAGPAGFAAFAAFPFWVLCTGIAIGRGRDTSTVDIDASVSRTPSAVSR
jgi:hypothetical protein